MCPSTSTKTNSFYKQLAILYGKTMPRETKDKQLAQVNYIWSKVESDQKKIKTVILIFQKESQLVET